MGPSQPCTNIQPGTNLQPQRSKQRIEQCLCVLQTCGAELLSEPAVDRGEEVAGLGGLALGLPEAARRVPAMRTLPSSTFDTPSSRAIRFTSTAGNYLLSLPAVGEDSRNKRGPATLIRTEDHDFRKRRLESDRGLHDPAVRDRDQSGHRV